MLHRAGINRATLFSFTLHYAAIMNALAQQLTTIITIFTTDWFNTGNRVLDSSMVAITVGAITLYGNYLRENWARLWNQWVYWWYDMKHRPHELDRAPYIIPRVFTEDMAARMDVSGYYYTPSYYYPCNRRDRLKGLTSNTEQYFSYIDQYLQMVHTPHVKKENGGKYVFAPLKDRDHYVKTLEGGLYPVAVTQSGEILYYSTAHYMVSFSYNAACYDEADILDRIVEKMARADLEQKKGEGNQLKIFVPSLNDRKEVNAIQPVGPISSKKTFDSLFFEQKPALTSLLKKFKDKTLYPPHVCMDTKLGILLYGPPGTGKTGTISAIANELQRNIVMINFAEIRLCKDLDRILDPLKNPYKDYVFVFDELDCILDALGELKKDEGPANDWGTMLLAAEGEERKQIIDMMRGARSFKPDATIDMAYLLQKLDGLVSAEDRVIVATTNNPDKINPALLRPGRFDLKLCLGPCSRTMLADILAYYYKGVEGVREAVMEAKLPEYAITPLELMNRAMQAEGIDALLADLRATLRTPVRRPLSRER